MNIQVSIGGPKDTSGTLVLVDVYKSSATITAALDNGAKFVIPCKSAQEAMEEKEKWKEKENLMLAGEKMGIKLEGFDTNISPLEMTKENVENKVVIYKSDNLTRVISKCKDAENVIIGGLTNSKTVANYLNNTQPERVEIIACGTYNKDAISQLIGINCDAKEELTMEDIIGAGSILHNLDGENLSDTALVSLLAYENPDWREKISQGCIIRALQSVGYEKDIQPCFSENESEIIPTLKDDRIVRLES